MSDHDVGNRVDLQPPERVQPLLVDGGDTRRLISTQIKELDEKMKKLTHKLENARRDMVRGAASEAYDARKRDVKPRP